MINLFDNYTATDCARKMKENGFFGDYIIATRSTSSNMSIIREALSVGSLKNSIWRIKSWSETPQGYYFWMVIFKRL